MWKRKDATKEDEEEDPFFLAIQSGDVKKVKGLIKEEEALTNKDATSNGEPAAEVDNHIWRNKRDIENRTPLMAACQYENAEMVQLFLTATTLWEVTTPSRNPAAQLMAKQHGWALWFAGIKVPTSTTKMRRHTAFVIASENGHLPILKLLLDFRRSNSAPEDSGESLAQKPRRDLLNQNEGTTALRAACLRGHVPCVEWLLEQGADAGLANQDTGTTPLLAACVFRHDDVVECLLRLRTAQELRFYEARSTTEGSTPYMLAAGGRKPALLKRLLEFDSENETQKKELLHAENQRGWTALDHAVIRQSMGIPEADEMVTLLLDAGAKAKPATFSRSLFMGGGLFSMNQLWPHRFWKPSEAKAGAQS